VTFVTVTFVQFVLAACGEAIGMEFGTHRPTSQPLRLS